MAERHFLGSAVLDFVALRAWKLPEEFSTPQETLELLTPDTILASHDLQN